MGEKGERPERVFPGRTDPWFIAAMVIVAGGLSAACIACFLEVSPQTIVLKEENLRQDTYNDRRIRQVTHANG